MTTSDKKEYEHSFEQALIDFERRLVIKVGIMFVVWAVVLVTLMKIL